MQTQNRAWKFTSSTRNSDPDLDPDSLSPSRIGGRGTNLEPSRRGSIAPIGFTSSIRNSDSDPDPNSLSPSRIDDRGTNLEPSRRRNITSIGFIYPISYLNLNTLSPPRIDDRVIYYFRSSRTLRRIYFLNVYQSFS